MKLILIIAFTLIMSQLSHAKVLRVGDSYISEYEGEEIACVRRGSSDHRRRKILKEKYFCKVNVIRTVYGERCISFTPSNAKTSDVYTVANPKAQGLKQGTKDFISGKKNIRSVCSVYVTSCGHEVLYEGQDESVVTDLGSDYLENI